MIERNQMRRLIVQRIFAISARVMLRSPVKLPSALPERMPARYQR